MFFCRAGTWTRLVVQPAHTIVACRTHKETSGVETSGEVRSLRAAGPPSSRLPGDALARRNAVLRQAQRLKIAAISWD